MDAATSKGVTLTPAAPSQGVVLARRGTLDQVLDVFLDRAAVLTPFHGVTALVGDFGASGAAVLDVLFGVVPPRGRLPIELPSSMAAVEASRPDVPSDTADPLFAFGHGLTIAQEV